MKLLLTLFISIASITTTLADNLVLIKLNSSSEKQAYFNNPNFKIYFQNDDFLIASSKAKIKEGIIMLDEKAWEENEKYSIVYVNETNKNSYLKTLNSNAKVCHSTNNMLFIKHYEQIMAAKNDGMIRILPHEVSLQKQSVSFPKISTLAKTEAFIDSLMDQVADSNLENTVQHLEDYGTRLYNSPEAALAETWIKEKYEAMGLVVSTQDFPQSGSSDNVIAIQTGTKYPNEYIVCGAHYDSYNNSGVAAPGADDNASGNSGILEIARILSQHEFDRSIVYCAWSAEEIGLVGSGYYASEAATNGMNILGYFNLDMIGYLQDGSEQHIDMLYADNAEPLAQFFMDICSVYFPGMPVERKFFSYGDSDHTSFNNNGYMGIFPFEDVDNYSPHIHTAQDLIGPSVNNFEMATVYTKATLASIATMANMKMPPQDFFAISGNNQIQLVWQSMFDIDGYKIYRDNNLISEIGANDTSYIDTTVVNDTSYSYYITCIYSDSGEESVPSETVMVTPMAPLSLPYLNDFENGINYWITEDNWGLTTADSYSPTHSIDDNPNNPYEAGMNSSIIFRSFAIPQNTEDIAITFRMKYELEFNYDYLYLEINTNGTWVNIDTYNGSGINWDEYNYSLKEYIGAEGIQIRFRIESDGYIEKEGVLIDDFSIQHSVSIVPNPPTNLSGILNNDTVMLSWEAPAESAPTGYMLYRNDSALFSEPTNSLSYIDTTILPNVRYCYTTTAMYDTIESDSSNIECIELIQQNVNSFEELQYSLYPNPAKDKIVIEALDMQSISIFNIQGKLMHAYAVNSNKKEISLGNYNKGIYLVEIKTQNQVLTTRLIKE